VDYDALSGRQQRQVRRAVRRGRRAQFPSGLAAAVADVAVRRSRRARRLLILAVVVILGSAGLGVALFLRFGMDPVLGGPVTALLVGGLVGVASESQLRRAEEAAALAAHQVTPPAGARR